MKWCLFPPLLLRLHWGQWRSSPCCFRSYKAATIVAVHVDYWEFLEILKEELRSLLRNYNLTRKREEKFCLRSNHRRRHRDWRRRWGPEVFCCSWPVSSWKRGFLLVWVSGWMIDFLDRGPRILVQTRVEDCHQKWKYFFPYYRTNLFSILNQLP